MAEFVMKHLVELAGLTQDFVIDSAATSAEELGNDIHPGTCVKLEEKGVPYKRRSARRIIPEDYGEYDLLVGMDEENMQNMRRCFGHDRSGKLHKLLEYTGSSRDVADPWFTGNFNSTYEDISSSCKALLRTLTAQK